MKLLKLTLFTLISIFCSFSYADDSSLLFEGCLSATPDGTHYNWSRPVITCDRLKHFQDGLQIINMAVLPASIALRAPGIKESLAVELASLGLHLANPAVLTITVVGAVGVASMYFVVRRKAEDCAKADQEALKRQLLNEMEQRYGLGSSPSLNLKVWTDQ